VNISPKKTAFSKSLQPMAGTRVQHHPILRRDLSVLLVDSAVDILDEVASLLRRREVTVHVAFSADDAMRLLTDHPEIGVVLADVSLLEGAGLTLAARVLGRQEPAIELVLIAGSRSADPRSPAMLSDLGMLQEPLKLRDIAVSVGRAIGRSAARRALPGALRLSAFDAD
jgi:DNA-binding NtrC family response regulator